MNWKGYTTYAQSDMGYRVAKCFAGSVAKYICYCPNKRLIDEPAFYSFKDAREACEKHYLLNNRQTEDDLF